MKTIQCTLVSLALFLLVGSGISFAQEGPPVPPRLGWPLTLYKFKDTNWNNGSGFGPRSFYGVEGVEGWWTNNIAMRITGTGPAWLQYNNVDCDTNQCRTNITFPEGGISFWVRPVNWSSTNIEGGTGPGVPARLFETGAYSEQGNWGWFSLFLDEAGTVLSLGVQSNQNTAVPIQAPVSWASNEWHMVALNYTLTNMEIYLDGQLASSVTNGLPFWPSDGVLLTNGFFIGSDSSGSNIANADFAYIRTYDWAMPEEWYSPQYNRILTNYIQGASGMNGMMTGGQLDGESLDAGTDLMLSASVTNDTLTLSISNAGTNQYDLFYITDLNLLTNSNPESSWIFVTRTYPGQTEIVVTNLPPSQSFFQLGTMQDTDGDLLTDAFENRISKTSVSNPDFDGDGLGDGYEWSVSHSSIRTPQAVPTLGDITIPKCPIP